MPYPESAMQISFYVGDNRECAFESFAVFADMPEVLVVNDASVDKSLEIMSRLVSLSLGSGEARVVHALAQRESNHCSQ